MGLFVDDAYEVREYPVARDVWQTEDDRPSAVLDAAGNPFLLERRREPLGFIPASRRR